MLQLHFSVHVCVYVCVCVCVCVCVYVHACVIVCARASIHEYVCTCVMQHVCKDRKLLDKLLFYSKRRWKLRGRGGWRELAGGKGKGNRETEVNTLRNLHGFVPHVVVTCHSPISLDSYVFLLSGLRYDRTALLRGMYVICSALRFL